MQEDEITEHILLECKAVTNVWGQCSKIIHKSKVVHKSLEEFLEEMFLKLDREEMAVLLVTL